MNEQFDKSATLDALTRASDRIAELEAQLEDRRASAPDAASRQVAVIGAAGRLASAASLQAYWDLLNSGDDAIRQPPEGRFDGLPRGSAPHLLAGYMDGIDLFDHRFFGIPADEARHMDPQQRLLLQVAFDAMQDAGLDVTALEGGRVGVYLGLAANTYGDSPGDPNPHMATGGQVSCAAGRLAYHFGFRGPVMTLDTACSSSLAAVHLAKQALRAGECDLALIGGSNLILSPDEHAVFAQLGLLAPEGPMARRKMPRKRSSTSAERAPAGYLVITAARIPGARRITLMTDNISPRPRNPRSVKFAATL